MASLTRVVLIGFSGTGKSTAGRLLCERLGWRLIDTDADIERQHSLTVPEIFAQHGEPFFRAAERAALLAGLGADHAVVATGGGAVVDEALWTADLLRRPGTLTVSLEASPETVLHRLRAQQAAEGADVGRPMIAGDDPLSRIVDLKARRQDIYDRSDVSLIVDHASPDRVAGEIAAILGMESSLTTPSVRLNASTGSSSILIKPGVSSESGVIARERWPNARKAWIVTDAAVGPLHAEPISASLAASGFITSTVTVPPGETSKSWTVAGEVLDQLLNGGIERSDVVIALGGGVIGDLAGFVAATVLRGVPLIQIPTSLLAMVDSSIGGKTGINHGTGKNLIGAFYQPPIVLIDPSLLRTLPNRDLTAGWAEVLKHGVIQPSTPGGDRGDLLTLYERTANRLGGLSDAAFTYLIQRNVALKSSVVEADEKETGVRAYLNFGHTMGHGIEAAGYRLLHGEAVAVGMRGAMRLAAGLDMISSSTVARFDALLDRYGLPTTASADFETVLTKMTSDKKRVAGRQRWVLPIAAGGVTIRDDVPSQSVEHALRAVLE